MRGLEPLFQSVEGAIENGIAIDFHIEFDVAVLSEKGGLLRG